MGDSQTTAELIELIRSGVAFSGGTTLDGNEGVEQIAAILTENAHPDFVTVMVSGSAPPQEHAGVAGFRKALGEWMSPYERFRLEIDEVITLPDKLVFLARQVATTKHDGVEIETRSATVWSLLDGRIRQAAFYLDRQAGLKAAGLDPDRAESGSG